jgi:hypothetical protein
MTKASAMALAKPAHRGWRIRIASGFNSSVHAR